MRLKVISFNIHKGFNWAKTKLTLERLKDTIGGSEADLIFLQEIVGENTRHARRYEGRGWPVVTQLDYIAQSIWHHNVYERNAVSTSGHHGNAVLSKYPIKQWRNVDISTNRYEKRGLLECHIQILHKRSHKETPLYAFCSHLNMAWGRLKQHQIITERILHIHDKKMPIILAGDFNDWDRKAEAGLVECGLQEAFQVKYGKSARTYPDFLPMLSLDRVYFKKSALG